MAFPVEPQDGPVDERGLFVVQDPELRARVLPLFRFDPRAASDRPEGHGTAFRIDLWSRCLTAWHVVEDLLLPGPGDGMTLRLRDDMRLAALQIDQQGYGRLPIPDGSWFPIREAFSLHRVEQKPFQQPVLRNLIELMVLRIRQRIHGEGTPYLPLDLGRWRPAAGERVLALGYADLDRPHGDEDQDRPFRQHLFGSMAQITHVEPAHPGRARPWPLIRVDADWPSGMSGGPVFNEEGHVVGLVSAGFQGEGGAAATYFSGWDMPERILGSIDRSNPGRFRCYGAFDDAGELAHCGQDQGVVERYGAEHGLTSFGMVSIDPHSGEWMHADGIGTLVRTGCL